MTYRRALLLILLGLLSPTLAFAGGAPRAEPIIYVVRHFDTPAGERDPDLTARGRSRVLALARWFRGKPLTAIYVTPFKRTAQTVAPLIETRKIDTKLYGPTPSAEMIAELRGARGPVLVVGHSNTVPDIVAALGAERPAPIAHEDFGMVWIVRGHRADTHRIEP